MRAKNYYTVEEVFTPIRDCVYDTADKALQNPQFKNNTTDDLMVIVYAICERRHKERMIRLLTENFGRKDAVEMYDDLIGDPLTNDGLRKFIVVMRQ